MLVLLLASLLLSGAVFGFFYAWSITVMRGLDLAAPPASIAVMQTVNASIMTPPFALIFFGTPIVLALASVGAFSLGGRTTGFCMGAATLAYMLGCFAVTVIFNVPMNDGLAAVDAAAIADPAATWTAYSRPWTAWNHVRTAGCGVALLATGLALRAWPG